jgi:coproporphyrinogen III oxidase
VASAEFIKASESLSVAPAFLAADDFGRLMAKEDAELAQIMQSLGLKKNGELTAVPVQPAGMDVAAVRTYLTALQERVAARLAAFDGRQFRVDTWQRPQGGGISRVLEDGAVFERGAVNFSHVTGATLPPSATAARPDLAGRDWEALGVSLVLHPRNPYVPTVHLNVRFFAAHSSASQPSVWWFGGGMDLTPYYGFEEDAVHFHRACRTALAPYGNDCYARYKRWCDEYFYIKHRSEPRGIGGIFFDDLNAPDFATCFGLQRSVGDAFLDAYMPIVERRVDRAYTEHEREWQAISAWALRRIQSGVGPRNAVRPAVRWTHGVHPAFIAAGVTWRYDWRPAQGSAEAKLYDEFLIAKDWLADE